MEVMREAVEYAVGIFHGSIMAIQSGRRGRSAGGICRFDVGATRFIPRRTPESGATSSRMCSPSIPAGSRRCFLSVSGQPNGERCMTESWWNGSEERGEKEEGRRTRSRRCKRDWRVCRATASRTSGTSAK